MLDFKFHTSVALRGTCYIELFDISQSQWARFLGEWKKLESTWQATLTNGCPENADLPFEPSGDPHRMFQEATRANLAASIACLSAMRAWLTETLAHHDHIAILGV